jgi:hypothetical protein
MKKLLATVGLAGLLSLAGLAVATGGTATPSTSLGACLDGWYVNPDETSRKPTPTAAGLKFEGNQLIHHGATGSIEGLAGGSFVASPAPDQPSFFSVEVRNADGSGYATLRWNPSTSKWSMVASGQLFEHATASELVKMTTPAKSSFLLSFGVGYTNSPPGTVATVVSSVTFRGTTYDLKCASSSSGTSASASASSSPSSKPPSASASGSASASASASATASATASASASTTPPPVTVGRLPTTGSSTIPLIAGTGGVLLLAGAALALWAYRRSRYTTEV